MKKYLVGLALVGSVFGFWSCAGESGGSYPAHCNGDADCGGGVCNPLGHVCMTTCTQASDCPQTERDCKPIQDAAGNALTTAKVCQCQTDQLCGGDTLVCHQVDKRCEPKCTSDTDCQGFSPARSCVSSQCAVSGGTTGGTDAGSVDAGPTCTQATQLTDCATNATNYWYQTCNAGACGSCTGNVGPNTNCDWGDLCGNGGVGICGPIQLDNCNNPGFSNHTVPPFYSSAFGPLITAVSVRGSSTSDPQNECLPDATGNPVPKLEITITFVSNVAVFNGGQSALLDHVQYYRASDGNKIKPAFAHGYTAASGATSGSFTVGVCGISSVNGAVVLLQDTSNNTGNAACVSGS